MKELMFAAKVLSRNDRVCSANGSIATANIVKGAHRQPTRARHRTRKRMLAAPMGPRLVLSKCSMSSSLRGRSWKYVHFIWLSPSAVTARRNTRQSVTRIAMSVVGLTPRGAVHFVSGVSLIVSRTSKTARRKATLMEIAASFGHHSSSHFAVDSLLFFCATTELSMTFLSLPLASSRRESVSEAEVNREVSDSTKARDGCHIESEKCRDCTSLGFKRQWLFPLLSIDLLSQRFETPKTATCADQSRHQRGAAFEAP